ncbi:hypothetical protein RJ640_019856 [Escallonia rubra]|uniref:Uncharacterized protein n=1 Tax=Escallonia rubra TaxID=112253 RepID=A0AA88RVU9_9ASTE|nr:hypothetical protein RJ640_019856 [Escallonia rubra]
MTIEAAPWWQYFLKTWQTLCHCTCEFPVRAMTPTAEAAPLAEKSSATMIRSEISSASVLPFFPAPPDTVEKARDPAAYEQAMAFATTKYLRGKRKSKDDMISSSFSFLRSTIFDYQGNALVTTTLGTLMGVNFPAITFRAPSQHRDAAAVHAGNIGAGGRRSKKGKRGQRWRRRIGGGGGGGGCAGTTT